MVFICTFSASYGSDGSFLCQDALCSVEAESATQLSQHTGLFFVNPYFAERDQSGMQLLPPERGSANFQPKREISIHCCGLGNRFVGDSEDSLAEM